MKQWRIRKGREVVREHHHTETRAESIPTDILDRIDALEARCSVWDAKYMEQERFVQEIIQAADTLLQRLQDAEVKLDLHNDALLSVAVAVGKAS